MKKAVKRAMALLLSAVMMVGSPAGMWAFEAEVFTDGNLFGSGEETGMDVVSEMPFVNEDESAPSAQAPDFDFPRLEKDPLGGVYFENLTEGYTKVPSQTVTIKNKYREAITVDVSNTEGIEVGRLSKTTLEPEETAQIVVKPALGFTEGQYHAYLYFDLKATNGKHFRDQMDVGFRVMPYIKLRAPYVKRIVAAENNCTVTLREHMEDADGYQVAAVTDTLEPVEEKMVASVDTTSLTARLKYLPRGRYTIICRSFANTKNGREYGNWRADYATFKVTDVTPEVPKLASASVRYCDLKLQVSAPQKIDGYDVVLSKRRKGNEPSDYVVYQKGFSGSSKEITLYDIPKGSYYVTVHAYKNNRAGRKVYSPWSNFKKITIEKTKVTTPPVLKDVKVSGRNVILTVSRVRGTHCSNWALAKSCYRDPEDRNHLIPRKFAYMEKGTKETKIIFRNVKPGNYYVSGCGYLSAYKRHYTKWSPLKKITVK